MNSDNPVGARENPTLGLENGVRKNAIALFWRATKCASFSEHAARCSAWLGLAVVGTLYFVVVGPQSNFFLRPR